MLAYFYTDGASNGATGASNGATEAVKGLIERGRSIAPGFRMHLIAGELDTSPHAQL